jgi:hypothetical protein
VRVEFVGLPAAGKTQACATAHRVMRDRGTEARLDTVADWRPQRRQVLADYLWLRARGQARVGAVSSAAWLARRAAAAGDAGPLRGWGACAYLVAVDTHVRRLAPDPLWLHDQATVQALWSVSMRAGIGIADVTDRYGPRISWPDLVVEKRAPLPTILDRLAARQVVPSSLGFADGGLVDTLRRGETTTAALREDAEARAVPWLVLDDDDAAGEMVAERVERILDETRQ